MIKMDYRDLQNLFLPTEEIKEETEKRFSMYLYNGFLFKRQIEWY